MEMFKNAGIQPDFPYAVARVWFGDRKDATAEVAFAGFKRCNKINELWDGRWSHTSLALIRPCKSYFRHNRFFFFVKGGF